MCSLISLLAFTTIHGFLFPVNVPLRADDGHRKMLDPVDPVRLQPHCRSGRLDGSGPRHDSSRRTRISRRARAAPRHMCAPPPPNETCGFGDRLMSNRCRLREGKTRHSSPTCRTERRVILPDPRVMELEVAGSTVRLKYTTGVAHRMISSVALGARPLGPLGAAPSDRGCQTGAASPWEIAVLVVSLPAKARARMNISNSWAPRASSSTSVIRRVIYVVTGVGRRCRAASVPDILVELGGRDKSRVGALIELRIGTAGDLVRPMDDAVNGPLRAPEELRDGVCGEMGGDLGDEVKRRFLHGTAQHPTHRGTVLVLELGDRPRGECPVDEPAQAGVLRGVRRR